MWRFMCVEVFPAPELSREGQSKLRETRPISNQIKAKISKWEKPEYTRGPFSIDVL